MNKLITIKDLNRFESIITDKTKEVNAAYKKIAKLIENIRDETDLLVRPNDYNNWVEATKLLLDLYFNTTFVVNSIVQNQMEHGTASGLVNYFRIKKADSVLDSFVNLLIEVRNMANEVFMVSLHLDEQQRKESWNVILSLSDIIN